MKSSRAGVFRSALPVLDALGALGVLVMLASPLAAQGPPPPGSPAPTPGRIRGTVVADSGGAPVAGAEISLPGLDRKVRTDSAGQYDLPNLRAGSTVVLVRAIGFRPDSTTVEVRDRLVVRLQLRLAYEEITVVRRGAVEPAQPLPTVTTKVPSPEETGKMSAFYSRKQMGIGRFVERTTLATWEGRRTGDLLATIGGMQVKRGGLRAWVANGRANDVACAFCSAPDVTELINAADWATGARPACYMDVYLDGALHFQYGAKPPQPLFDVNSIEPSSLEGIEVYTGAAQIPAQYNTQLTSGCGVLLIWTRVPPPKSP